MNCKYFGECGACRVYENGYESQLNEKKELNQKRFEEMKETYNKYISKYKKFVLDLVKNNNPKNVTLFMDYVVSRIGSKYGIRPYILRKFFFNIRNMILAVICVT